MAVAAARLRLRIERGEATPADAEQALGRLDTQQGIYFGVDAGIAGLHPLQATLLHAPALRLRLWDDGLQAEALDAFGQALLAQPALAAWHERAGRGRCEGGPAVLALARAFLACFEPSPDALLLGALRFEAHRLQAASPPAPGDPEPLGVLYFPSRMLRRDAAGRWQALGLSLDGAGPPDVPVPMPAAAPASVTPVAGDDYPPGGYAAMVARAVELLRQREELVSLTLSQSYRRQVAMAPSAAFARLRAANPAPASFFVNDGSGMRLFGASPDLQLVLSGGQVQALPVCGTVARQPGAQGEAESLRELFNEEVDAAALAVCSDALRNDLAPLCEPGSLHLADRRRPMSLATVVHAVDRVAGRLRSGVDAWDAIAATAAPVMLTGTPRAAALRAIAELEASPRGWYGGMVVQVASDGDALVGTLLRAACVRAGVAEVRTGGDLLADSSPEREEAESRLKTRSVWRAFGLAEGVVSADAADQARARRRPSDMAGGEPAARLPHSVQLAAQGDPFLASLQDCLAGLGVSLSAKAPLVVAAGAHPPALAAGTPVVAIGDAAYRLLSDSGLAVETEVAQHGRAWACFTTPHAPVGAGLRFWAGRYARHRLVGDALAAGWTSWACGPDGAPVLLARPGCACLLYRPDSVLSDGTALGLFAAALSRVAVGT